MTKYQVAPSLTAGIFIDIKGLYGTTRQMHLHSTYLDINFQRSLYRALKTAHFHTSQVF